MNEFLNSTMLPCLVDALFRWKRCERYVGANGTVN